MLKSKPAQPLQQAHIEIESPQKNINNNNNNNTNKYYRFYWESISKNHDGKLII